jgi:hypothetical protein
LKCDIAGAKGEGEGGINRQEISRYSESVALLSKRRMFCGRSEVGWSWMDGLDGVPTEYYD